MLTNQAVQDMRIFAKTLNTQSQVTQASTEVESPTPIKFARTQSSLRQKTPLQTLQGFCGPRRGSLRSKKFEYLPPVTTGLNNYEHQIFASPVRRKSTSNFLDSPGRVSLEMKAIKKYLSGGGDATVPAKILNVEQVG